MIRKSYAYSREKKKHLDTTLATYVRRQKHLKHASRTLAKTYKKTLEKPL
jgi:hypothetical protein